MKRTSAIAHFRRLCCLGLQPQAVMPSLLSAAHELLPSETNGFFWADEEGRLAGFTPEYPVPEAALHHAIGGIVRDTAEGQGAGRFRGGPIGAAA